MGGRLTGASGWHYERGWREEDDMMGGVVCMCFFGDGSVVAQRFLFFLVFCFSLVGRTG